MSKKKEPAAEGERGGVSVASTPKAAGAVRRLKSWGGLAGFAVVYLLSWRQGLPLPDAALRALLGGLVGSTAAWAAGVAIWRHLLRAQAAAAARAAAERRRPRPSGGDA